MIILSWTSCTIGVKRKVIVVFVNYSDDPEIKGGIRIGTNNKKMIITAAGEVVEKDLGGWYAIQGTKLKALLDAAKGRE